MIGSAGSRCGDPQPGGTLHLLDSDGATSPGDPSYLPNLPRPKYPRTKSTMTTITTTMRMVSVLMGRTSLLLEARER